LSLRPRRAPYDSITGTRVSLRDLTFVSNKLQTSEPPWATSTTFCSVVKVVLDTSPLPPFGTWSIAVLLSLAQLPLRHSRIRVVYASIHVRLIQSTPGRFAHAWLATISPSSTTTSMESYAPAITNRTSYASKKHRTYRL
jgi:hypothetical protein